MESKKVEFFNKLSFVALIVTLFLSLFFFIPYISVTSEASKGFILSVGTSLSLLFWLISRLGDGKFVFPNDRLILFGAAIPVVFLISSFFSSSLYVSLFGSGFEIGTFGSMLVMFLIFFLSSIYFQSEKRLYYFLWSLIVGGIFISVFQVLSLFNIFNKFLPGFTLGLSSGNLVGSWNNLALLFGLFVLIALFTLELLNTRGLMKIFNYILLVMSLLLLIILNIPFIWLILGVFSIVIFVYSTSIQRAGVSLGESTDGVKVKKFPFTSLIVIFISILLLISSNLASSFISRYISFNNSEVRPSIVTTSQVAYKALMHNPVLGTGPNTFVIDWALWQPKQIAQTIFWNVDFNSGYSFLLTLLATVGILGFLSMVIFMVIYVMRGIQSIKIALQNQTSNYFIITTLLISIYTWIIVIMYNPTITILALAFASSGALLGVLVYKKAIPNREFAFLNDPRSSFFSILGLVVLMIVSVLLAYVYIEKFTSLVYFSKGLNSKSSDNVEILQNAETMITRAIVLDKNDIYYRTLSQVYLNEMGVLSNNKELSGDILKSELQKLVNFAQSSANLAVSQNPKQYLNYLNLGNVYASMAQMGVENSYESALAAYNQASLYSPNNPSIILAKAVLEYSNKNTSASRDYIKQALALKPNYIDAIFFLSQIETAEGNLGEAIKQAEYAGEMAPNDPTVFFRLGLLRYNNSNYTGSISAFEKAVMLDNTYVNARYFLAMSYKKVGRKSDALTQFNILNKLIPNNKEIEGAISSIDNTDSQEEDNVKDNKTIDTKTKLPLEEKR